MGDGTIDPGESSVVHSTNDGDTGTTTDTVDVSLERDRNGIYTYTVVLDSTHGQSFTVSSDDTPYASYDEQGFAGAEFYKAVGDGHLYVDLYANIGIAGDATTQADPEAVTVGAHIVEDFNADFPTPGFYNGVAGVFSVAGIGDGWEYLDETDDGVDNGVVTGLEGNGVTFIPDPVISLGADTDTNWLAGGIWLYFPDSASSVDDFEIGAFADGGDPFDMRNIDGLTGNPVYEGEGTGIYVEDYATGGGEIGYTDFDLRLTASFGTNSQPGTIDGHVYNIRYTSPTDGYVEVDGAIIPLPFATITDAADGGFFKAEGANIPQTVDGVTSQWDVSWGGQLFGNGDAVTDHPTSMGGTFAASTDSNSDGNEESIVGIWGAFKE